MFIGGNEDFVRILEAAYAEERDDRLWAQNIVEAARRTFGNAPVGFSVLRHEDDFRAIRTELLTTAGFPTPPRAIEHTGPSLPPEAIKAFFYPRALATTHSEVEVGFDRGTAESMARYRQAIGCSDVVGILAHPEPRTVAVLSLAMNEMHRLNKEERRLLSRIALHLESATRLRRNPDAVLAVVSSNGRILHREPHAPPDEVLAAGAKVIDQVRRRSARGGEKPIALWRALLAGHVTLVERGSNGKRHYLVLENPAASVSVRRLSVTEVSVLSLAARGISGKLLSYAVGLSVSSVSRTLDSAAHKLGIGSRLELIRVASQMAARSHHAIDVSQLTPTERVVLDLVRRGLSNADIATVRHRSERTIANQVAALLRKTNSTTRRALIAADVDGADGPMA
jgi:DNA-binding NarL/FixJ family response regulator